MKLAVVLATYNEEKNLKKCLDSVKILADEIIVVDGESTDKTREIARKAGAKVLVAKNEALFHKNKQKAVEAASADWILQLDADEIVPAALAAEITAVINEEVTLNGYYLPRQAFLLGQALKKGGFYPDPVIRLFRRGQGHFPCQSVHEQIEIKGDVGYLKNALIHNAYPDFSEYLRKANTYTSLTAAEMKRQKLAISAQTFITYLVIKPFLIFGSLYFRHLGFFDGFPGFVWAFFSGLHQPIAFIKYWEKVHVE